MSKLRATNQTNITNTTDNNNNGNLRKFQFLSRIFEAIKYQLGIGKKTNGKYLINSILINKYWSDKSTNDIINEADQFYQNGNYLKSYKLLNHMKFSNNIEIKWRLGRALYKLSYEENLDEKTRYNMMSEAYDIMMSTFPEGSNSSNIHKWTAIIIDRKTGMDSLKSRMKHSKIVKNHLVKSCELNPNDVTIQYLLGRWCYEMTHITWFQRIIAKFLYHEPPKSSYEEANKYLTKVEDLQPRLYIQNTYFLGKTCLKLGQYYRAKYYLNIVANSNLKNCSEIERKYIFDSQHLIKKLSKYNLNNNLLLYEYPFGVNE